MIDDIAFPVMDFGARGRSDFAFRLLNGWLDRTGDHGAHAGTALLGRLPGAGARPGGTSARRRSRSGGGAPVRRRRRCTGRARRRLAWSSPTACRARARPSSRSACWNAKARSGCARTSNASGCSAWACWRTRDRAGLDLYNARGDRTDLRTPLCDGALAAAGRLARWCIDAAFLLRAERTQALALARELQVPCAILDCQAPPEVLRERLLARRAMRRRPTSPCSRSCSSLAQPLEQDELARVRKADDGTAATDVPTR